MHRLPLLPALGLLARLGLALFVACYLIACSRRTTAA
ncbi:hypothetical protein HNQ58_000505 [Rehaibacterium terrae]|jgi:hypothetical protein|uniref:Uncharacterized protein n=1 Tax=Rehaibacterium terrae TaxID=1341696 RepID=A0A7W7XXV4_9GAMM|nr:hypothetical protein [Rehaibacterium terrae]